MIVPRMRLVVLLTALALWQVGLIADSGRQIKVLRVNPGDNVTLTCSNNSEASRRITWFKLKNKAIQELMFGEKGENYSHSSNNEFEISSNLTTVFLKINQVNSSDAGFYFCGYNQGKKTIILDLTTLKVQDQLINKSFQISYSTMILVGVIIFLSIVIFGLAVRIKKLQGGGGKEQGGHQSEEQTQDRDVTYSSVFLRPKNKPVQRPPSGLDHVVYSDIREKVEAEAAAGNFT